MSEDLLKEIEGNPEFAATPREKMSTILSRRIDLIELQVEALQLLFRVKNIFSEKEYQLAIKHIVDLMEYCEREHPTLNEEFFENSKIEFEKTLKFLEIDK